MKPFIQAEEEAKPALRPPRWLRGTLRLVLGIGLITFLIARSDLDAIRRALIIANPLFIVAGYVLHIALLIASAFRWRVFLEALQIRLPTATTVKLTLIGSFFNAFLPTGVGGDAYKAVRVRSANSTLAVSFASVLLDRLAGIAALAAVSVPVAMLLILRSETTPLVLVALSLSTGVLAATTLVLVRGQTLLGRGRGTWFSIRPRLRRALDATTGAIRGPTTIRRSFPLSLVCQAFAIAAYVALARSLDLEISAGVITLGLLSATLAAAIPITVNGLGVREAVWVWCLGLYGVEEGEALAFALLVLAVSLGTSAFGGLTYAFAGGRVGLGDGT